MPRPTELLTERLLLRPWRETDLAPFARLNGDPRVMEFFPATLERPQSDALASRLQAHIDAHGFGFWALERRADGAFLGFTGLKHNPDLPFSPCVEIGWRLDLPYWGAGYASEAARACLGFGLGALGLERIVAVTALPNLRSQAVMRRLGMHDTGQVFEHPGVAPGHWLRPHCRYEIDGASWHAGR